MSKKKLLCVEDDSINAFIMEKLLADEFHIKIVGDGEGCMHEVKAEKYDAILMDINLGRGKQDGTELLRMIKEIPDYWNTPIFAITSYALTGDREKFLKLGFDNYFSKPIDKTELIGEINMRTNDS